VATHARHVAAASGQILLHSAALHTLLQLSTCSEEMAATPSGDLWYHIGCPDGRRRPADVLSSSYRVPHVASYTPSRKSVRI
jgi:hypothetical protein